MTAASLLRKTYDGVAWFAILNTLFMGGLIGYLGYSGAVDGDKLRKFVAVMRGADLATSPPADAAPATNEEKPKPKETLSFAPVTAQIDLEVYRREADRIQEELRQRLALNNSILLRVTTERENFRRQREEAAKLTDVKREKQQSKGFEKQVSILESINPTMAVEHLLSLGNVEEAAGILMAMNDRKAKRIVEAGKKPAQRKKMNLILQSMKDSSSRIGDRP